MDLTRSDEIILPEGSTTPAPLPFTRLEPRVIQLWRLQHLFSSLILLAFAGVPVLFTALSGGNPFFWGVTGWVALALLRFGLWLWYPPAAYSAWGYRIDARVLETQRGVIFKVTQLLPLQRLQHVDLNRGPLERYYGLASLALHTAGTQEAVIRLPGLNETDALRLRDQLVAIGGDDGV